MTTKFGWLELFAQVFKDDVADRAGEDGDGEILEGEDVVQGDAEGLACAVGTVELSHQEVGIEEEDDETDLDYGPPDVGGEADVLGVLGHGLMVQNSGGVESIFRRVEFMVCGDARMC